jgi:hypothetical protein
MPHIINRVTGGELPCETYHGRVKHLTAMGDIGNVDFTVVLIEPPSGAAYAMIGSGADEWICRHGRRLDARETELYFPGFTALSNMERPPEKE